MLPLVHLNNGRYDVGIGGGGSNSLAIGKQIVLLLLEMIVYHGI